MFQAFELDHDTVAVTNDLHATSHVTRIFVPRHTGFFNTLHCFHEALSLNVTGHEREVYQADDGQFHGPLLSPEDKI